MKLKTWESKCARTIDTALASDDVRFCSRNDCVLVAPTGDHYFIVSVDNRILYAGKDSRITPKLNDHYEHVLHSDAKLAVDHVLGHFTGCRNQIVKLSSASVPDVFVQAKFIRKFPKDAMFYIENSANIVTVCLWEKGQAHIIGAIMPILPMYRDFIPAEK